MQASDTSSWKDRVTTTGYCCMQQTIIIDVTPLFHLSLPDPRIDPLHSTPRWDARRWQQHLLLLMMLTTWRCWWLLVSAINNFCSHRCGRTVVVILMINSCCRVEWNRRTMYLYHLIHNNIGQLMLTDRRISWCIVRANEGTRCCVWNRKMFFFVLPITTYSFYRLYCTLTNAVHSVTSLPAAGWTSAVQCSASDPLVTASLSCLDWRLYWLSVEGRCHLCVYVCSWNTLIDS